MCAMDRAYQAAAKGYRERLSQVNPEDERLLKNLKEADTIVVEGTYDHAQDVLRALDIPFGLANPNQVGSLDLRPEQSVLINCPGQLDRAGISKIRGFVEAGGYLVTTDWDLKHVIETAFPGTLAYNNVATADDVVRVEVVDGGAEFLKDLMDEKDDPQWWLEGSSYPIKLLDPKRVEVLITSKEMKEKYGEATIAVRFSYGKGMVYHIVSHYYLQRSETRTARQKGAGDSYLVDKGAGGAARYCTASEPLGEVEAAFTSAGFLGKILTEKQRKK